MNRIRVAALGAALMVSFAAVAEAQERPERRGGRPEAGERPGMRQGQEQQSQMLFRGITLTAAQQEQVRVIQERHRTGMMEQRRQMMGERGEGRPATPADSATRAQMRAQMEARAEARRTELRAVLTPEQAVIFDRNVAEMRERMQRREGQRPGPAGRAGQRGQRGR